MEQTFLESHHVPCSMLVDDTWWWERVVLPIISGKNPGILLARHTEVNSKKQEMVEHKRNKCFSASEKGWQVSLELGRIVWGWGAGEGAIWKTLRPTSPPFGSHSPKQKEFVLRGVKSHSGTQDHYVWWVLSPRPTTTVRWTEKGVLGGLAPRNEGQAPEMCQVPFTFITDLPTII